MSPNFLPDSFVFAIKHPWQRLAVGDVILVNHDNYGKMIKRIASITNHKDKHKDKRATQQTITLKSDNPLGVTSEQIGIIDSGQIIGKVIWQVKPPKQ